MCAGERSIEGTGGGDRESVLAPLFNAVGCAVGCAVGRAVGLPVGRDVGLAFGREVGCDDGCAVGRGAGCGVGAPNNVGCLVGLGKKSTKS